MAFQSNVMRTDLSSTLKVVESPAASYEASKTNARFADATCEEEQLLASDNFCKIMESMISQEDIKMLLEKQKEAITKFEKINETFGRFNDLSAARFAMLNHQFASHTKMLLEMKKDLDSVFRRIRTLKTKLMKQYGHAFYATSASIQKLEEELGASIESETAAGESKMTGHKGQDASGPEALNHKITEKEHSNHETESCENKEEASLTHLQPAGESKMTGNKGQDAGHESGGPEALNHKITGKEHSSHETESCENKEEASLTHPASDGLESTTDSKTNTLDSAGNSKLVAICNVNNKEEVTASGPSVDQDFRNEEHLHKIESADIGCHQQIDSWKHGASLKLENNSSDCLNEEELNIGRKIVDNSVDCCIHKEILSENSSHLEQESN